MLTGVIILMNLPPVLSQRWQPEFREDIPLDSIRLSDPCILADKKTSTYYMTGSGGWLWKSRDLEKWTGPYWVVETDPGSWMGPRPMIWAAELHAYKGRYYYFATFTNRDVKIELKPDLSGTIGAGKVLFRASDSPWSEEKDEQGNIVPSKVTDGPWLFLTQTGKLGMLWTSWVYSDYTQGVAYSESGTLDGPWVQDPEPITPPNYGHGMLFRTFEGKLLMSVHSHGQVNGHTVRIPCLFEMDDSGDKLVLGAVYSNPVHDF